MDYSDFIKYLYEKNKKSSLDKIIDYLREKWWKYIIAVLTEGVLALFLFGFIYDKVITVEVMNLWVGIILGLVATAIGIISMILSFYNLDQSIKTQKETLDKIDNIKKEIIEYVEKSSDRAMEAYNNSVKTDSIKYNEKGGWDNVER